MIYAFQLLDCGAVYFFWLNRVVLFFVIDFNHSIVLLATASKLYKTRNTETYLEDLFFFNICLTHLFYTLMLAFRCMIARYMYIFVYIMLNNMITVLYLLHIIYLIKSCCIDLIYEIWIFFMMSKHLFALLLLRCWGNCE